jgi:hypothetical protein
LENFHSINYWFIGSTGNYNLPVVPRGLAHRSNPTSPVALPWLHKQYKISFKFFMLNKIDKKLFIN